MEHGPSIDDLQNIAIFRSYVGLAQGISISNVVIIIITIMHYHYHEANYHCNDVRFYCTCYRTILMNEGILHTTYVYRYDTNITVTSLWCHDVTQ